MSTDLEQGDKTEQPTARRRQEARSQGDVARSSDLSTAVAILAAVGALYFLGGDLAGELALTLKSGLASPPSFASEPAEITAHLQALARRIAGSLAGLLGVLVFAAVAINAAQVGFFATAAPLRPDVSRLSPVAGFRRLVSRQGAGRLAGSLLKLAVVVAIVSGFVMGKLPAFLAAGRLDTAALCRQLGSWIVSLGLQLAVGLSALAVLDYGWQLWLFEQRIRMTRQEVLDELRHTEGDPQVKKRRRELQRRVASAPSR